MSTLEQYIRFVIEIFSLRFLPLHLGVIIVTIILVFSGLDWAYFVYVLSAVPASFLHIADATGFILPSLLMMVSIGILVVSRKKLERLYAEAMIYAILLGITLSTIIKAFTGRISPPHFHYGEAQAMIDNSQAFNFGFLRESVMGGWPSSHATIAFAIAVTLILLLPKRWYVFVTIFAPALFISIGVTFGFHWLSEFIAGTSLGTVIGLVVGGFYNKNYD